MNSPIHISHWNDSNGNPAGGCTFGRGFCISWQNGPLGRGANRRQPNGAFVEDIIKAAMDRLEFYQSSRFSCPENNRAIGYLTAALQTLASRTADRESRKVEGIHAA